MLAGKKKGLEIALGKIESNFVESQIAGAKTIKWMLEEEGRRGGRNEEGGGKRREMGGIMKKEEGRVGGGERMVEERENMKKKEEGRKEGESKMDVEGRRKERGQRMEEEGGEMMEEEGGRKKRGESMNVRKEGGWRENGRIEEDVFSDGKMEEIWRSVRNLIFDEDEEELKIVMTGLVSAIVKHLNGSYNEIGVLTFSKFELIMNIIQFLTEEIKIDFMSDNSGISIKIFTVSLFFSSFLFSLLFSFTFLLHSFFPSPHIFFPHLIIK